MAFKSVALAIAACVLFAGVARAAEKQCVYTGNSCALSAAYVLSLPAAGAQDDTDQMVGKIAAYSHACGKHTAAEACAADKANYCRFNPNLSPSCDVDVSRAFTAQACGISFSGTPCVVYTAANAQCTSWPIENCPAPYCKLSSGLCTIDTTTGAAPFFAGAIDSGSAFSKGILAAAAKCATFTKEQCAGTGAAAASAAASTAYLAFKPFVQDLTDGFVTTVGADGAFTLVKPAAVEGLPVAKVGEDEPAIIAPKPTNADGTPVQTSTSTGTGVTTTSTGSGSGSTSMVTDSTTKTGSSNLEAGKNSTNAAYTRAMAAGTLLAAAGAAVLLL